MEREMAFHIDSLAPDNAQGGMSGVDAQHVALRRFGDLTRLKERGHDERTTRLQKMSCQTSNTRLVVSGEVPQ
jgi:hypothetical protein